MKLLVRGNESESEPGLPQGLALALKIFVGLTGAALGIGIDVLAFLRGGDASSKIFLLLFGALFLMIPGYLLATSLQRKRTYGHLLLTSEEIKVEASHHTTRSQIVNWFTLVIYALFCVGRLWRTFVLPRQQITVFVVLVNLVTLMGLYYVARPFFSSRKP